MPPSDPVLFTLTRLPFAVSADHVAERLYEAGNKRGLDLSELALLARNVRSEWFPHGCVIDLQRILGVMDHGSLSLREAATLSRIKLQGTDGIRGRIVHEEGGKRDALELFLTKGVLCPGFFRLNGEAFVRYLVETGGLEENGTILIGEDGRDRLTGAGVVPALIRGLNTAGASVLDAGVIPTPGVPIASRKWACRGGVIITASHNPSNQNGIKLLHDGFKLMDDGPQGEYGLTRMIFSLADEDGDWAGYDQREDLSIQANALLRRIILENLDFPKTTDRSVTVAYDGANGAFSEMAPEIIKTLGLDARFFNVEAKGFNINQNGGVGEIEGASFFPGRVSHEVLSSYFPVVGAVFESGRSNPQGLNVGIVNDGDGDRGYLLVYEADQDRVVVVPGDELALLILWKRHSDGDLANGASMVNSVESDIMASGYARARFGVQSETACVGDKWLLKPAREGRPFVVGCEESGHVTFGVDVPTADGTISPVFTGNGLLSTLTVLEFALKEGLSSHEITRPFPPGHKDIRYVYFVEKGRFLPGTEIFQSAGNAILSFLKSNLDPMDVKVRTVPFADAPEMLYVGAYDRNNILVGSVFVRNSGTESKTGVAIRCRKDLTDIFDRVMQLVYRNELRQLKDSDAVEARMEKILVGELAKGPRGRHELLAALGLAGFPRLTEVDFNALLYAMKKQRIIGESGNLILLKDMA